MTRQDRINAYNAFMQKGGANIISAEELDTLGFFTAPASTKYHGAYEGGLFDHSLEVARQLVNLTDKLGLKWEVESAPYIVGMFHDFCKVDQYVEADYLGDLSTVTGRYEYNPDIIIPGHGDKSVIMLQKYVTLTDEKIACIRWHMGAYERDPKMWEYYGKAIECYPNVLYTHTADMIASRIIGV